LGDRFRQGRYPPPGYEKAEIEVVHKLAKERKLRMLRGQAEVEEAWRVGFEARNSGEALL